MICVSPDTGNRVSYSYRTNLYLRYDRSRIVERIRQMISQPLPG